MRPCLDEPDTEAFGRYFCEHYEEERKDCWRPWRSSAMHKTCETVVGRVSQNLSCSCSLEVNHCLKKLIRAVSLQANSEVAL